MKEIMKEAGIMFVGLMLLGISGLSYLALAFAFRDFSWILLAQFVLTPIGIPLGWYLLQKASRGDFKTKSISVVNAELKQRINQAIKLDREHKAECKKLGLPY